MRDNVARALDYMGLTAGTAIRDIASLYDKTPLETLKLWQAFHIADQAAPYLTKAMVDSRFAFTSSLSGVSEQRPRWKRAVDMVNTSLGELVGQAYVGEYFPEIAKQRMDDLVRNLKLAMADRIRGNEGCPGRIIRCDVQGHDDCRE